MAIVTKGVCRRCDAITHKIESQRGSLLVDRLDDGTFIAHDIGCAKTNQIEVRRDHQHWSRRMRSERQKGKDREKRTGKRKFTKG